PRSRSGSPPRGRRASRGGASPPPPSATGRCCPGTRSRSGSASAPCRRLPRPLPVPSACPLAALLDGGDLRWKRFARRCRLGAAGLLSRRGGSAQRGAVRRLVVRGERRLTGQRLGIDDARRLVLGQQRLDLGRRAESAPPPPPLPFAIGLLGL